MLDDNEELIADILNCLHQFYDHGTEHYTTEYRQYLLNTIEELEAYVS